MRRRFWPTLALLPCALACTSEAPSRQDEALPNVILISIDTLRADHLGSYGYDKPTSPNLDRLRADGVQFDQTIAPAPSTLHSHASILSSLLPHHHRASWAAKTRLPEEVVSLPEILREAGYQTAAFTGGGQMDRVFGLDQGFDAYRQPGAERFRGTVTAALEWLRDEREGTFFLFLHSYEPHHPYAPDPEYLELFEDEYVGSLPDEIPVELLRAINRSEIEVDAADLSHIVATYDAEIRSMDDGLGYLVDALREMDLYEETMIVFTSDHGEEFGEHGRIGWHSHSLYDELLRVPLIIKFPRSTHAGGAVESLTRSLDIAPTVLDAVGLSAPQQFSGVSLLDLVRGGGESGLIAVSRMDRPARRDISSVRTADWKLYRNQLFNLGIDGDEQWDAAVNHPDVVADLERRLTSAIESRTSFEEVQVVPDDATLEDLRALGYLQ